MQPALEHFFLKIKLPKNTLHWSYLVCCWVVFKSVLCVWCEQGTTGSWHASLRYEFMTLRPMLSSPAGCWVKAKFHSWLCVRSVMWCLILVPLLTSKLIVLPPQPCQHVRLIFHWAHQSNNAVSLITNRFMDCFCECFFGSKLGTCSFFCGFSLTLSLNQSSLSEEICQLKSQKINR